MLLLVTGQLTLPVGFAFYIPYPVQTQWEKKDKKLKKQGITKNNRPIRPKKNDKYPTKLEIAIQLLEDFKCGHPNVKVKAILADALYGTANFMDKASAKFGDIQVISLPTSQPKYSLPG